METIEDRERGKKKKKKRQAREDRQESRGEEKEKTDKLGAGDTSRSSSMGSAFPKFAILIITGSPAASLPPPAHRKPQLHGGRAPRSFSFGICRNELDRLISGFWLWAASGSQTLQDA